MNERAGRIALVALATFSLALLGACGGGGSSGSKVVKTATAGTITVTARDLSFDVGTIDTSPGPLTVTFVNKGAMYHTFRILGTSFELKANAGQTKSGTVTLAKGTYKFDCAVPGHAAAGMKGRVVVA